MFFVRAPRLIKDGNFLNKEFDIVPSTGQILPEGNVVVQIDLISTTVQVC